MSNFENLNLGGAAQPSPPSYIYNYNNSTGQAAALTVNSALYPNFSTLYPGTSDFCWEAQIIYGYAPNWGCIFSFGSDISTTFFGFSLESSDGGATWAAVPRVIGVAGTVSASFALSGWTHLAMIRSGSTISGYINGQLTAQLTGVTSDINATTVGASDTWLFGGPVGDRDQDYPYPLRCLFRNVRWTIGSSVYGSSTFTPPPATTNLAGISGSQYLLIPTDTSYVTYGDVSSDLTSPSITFQNYVQGGPSVIREVIFTPYNVAPYPQDNGSYYYEYPDLYSPSVTPGGPFLTQLGPTPPFGTYSGNFTMTGTDVRISCPVNDFTPGSSDFTMLLWFYVPGNIVNEMKTIIYTDVTNGLVLQLGRTGMGIDWVCVADQGGTELAYGEVVWARNQWNNLIIQRRGTAINAWVGNRVGNWAYKVPLTDNGLGTYAFSTAAATTSIGCVPGSTVSCQLYINQIWLYQGVFYAGDYDYVPVQTYSPFRYGVSYTMLEFQGEYEGSTIFWTTPQVMSTPWQNVTATTGTGPTTAYVNADPPQYNAGYAQYYETYASPGNILARTEYSYPILPMLASGLNPGTTYTFTLRSVNNALDPTSIMSAPSNPYTPLLNGALWSWGYNGSGQLGQGDTTTKSSPVQVGALTTWANSAAGNNFSLMVKNDNTLWAWGDNSVGCLGQGTLTNASSPVQVGALTNWLWVAAGYGHAAAIKTDGTLWTWGNNTSGQLGHGDTTSVSSPTQVGTLTDWRYIAASSSFTVATKTDGTLWAWGQNNRGQLGNSTTTNYSSPVQVGALTTWSSITAGYNHTVGILTDGTMWAWGYNAYGQLGTNNTTTTSSPVVVGSFTDWSQVIASGDTTIAIRNDGSLWSWGLNSAGQLGQGNLTNRSTPTQVGALNTWLKVSLGGNHGSDANGGVSAYAIRLDGSLWAWGNNSLGQLGLGTTASNNSPTQVGALTTWGEVFAGNLSAAGVIQTAQVTPPAPVNVIATVAGSTSATVTFDPGLSPVTSFTVTASPGGVSATGSTRTITVTGLASATTYTFTVTATNGTGTSPSSAASNSVTLTTTPSAPLNPVATVTGTTTASVSFTPPASNGGLAITGYTATSSPGGITSTGSASPLTFTGLTQGTAYTFTVKATNSGGTGPDSVASNAVIPNGTLYAWGNNSFGQVAQNNHATNYSAPQQISGTTQWLSLAGSYDYSTGAVRSDNTLWTWGRGDVGQLGLGGYPGYQETPAQVGLLTNWRQTVVGGDFMFALKTDGTIWSWGENMLGQLGLGNTTTYDSPKQIGSLTSWIAIAAGRYSCYAIRSNGSMWGWGSNSKGELGQGTTVGTSSPVQIGLLPEWTAVFAGGWASAFAIKTDGTLWAWGLNNSGQLGVGDTTNRSALTQVGALTTWRSVAVLSDSVIATKNDGTMWAWGNNSSGYLGLGNTTNFSSPVQSGTYNNWYQAMPGAGIKGDGTLWTWGYNASGELGLGNLTSTSSPQQVGTYRWTSVSHAITTVAIPMINVGTAPTAPINVTATELTGASATISWTATSFPVFTYTVTASPSGATQTSSGSPMTFTGLAAGQPYTFTVTATNTTGTSAASSPSNSVTLTQGAAYGFGANTGGQLGLGNTTNANTVTQIGALTDWDDIAGGSAHGIGVRTNGTLWSWGTNTYGQLGLGDTTSRSSPTQIGALTTWARVSCGQEFSMAVKTDGTLWTWGRNAYGQLGLGNTTNRSSPVQVGALANWATVSGGFYHALATKTNGTLWAWGYGAVGQLGQNSGTSFSSPVQVGSLTNWLSVSAGSYHSTAISTSGGLNVCGSNASGELGFGSSSGQGQLYMVQIGGTWSKVSAGPGWTMGIQTNGTLWACGDNSSGQLGQGNTTSRAAMVQIGSLTTWTNLGQGSTSYQSLATQTYGTLWQWGACWTASYSSPVQVGSAQGWVIMGRQASGYVAIRGQ